MSGALPFPLAARAAPRGWRLRRGVRRSAWALLWAATLGGAAWPYLTLYREYRPPPHPVRQAPAEGAPAAAPPAPPAAPAGTAQPMDAPPTAVAGMPPPAVVVKRSEATPPAAPTRGERLASDGRWTEAATWYRRRLDDEPGWLDGWAGLAAALTAVGHGDQAAAAWRHLQALAPLDRRAAAGLALAEPSARAERRLRALLREGREPWLLAALGRLRAVAGDRAGALAAYREALRRAPGDGRLRAVVAQLTVEAE
ncbi:tetratricopeptide repeat protein [Endothiovibrio diazotrophicus]